MVQLGLFHVEKLFFAEENGRGASIARRDAA
jgi:hypothetical protein